MRSCAAAADGLATAPWRPPSPLRFSGRADLRDDPSAAGLAAAIERFEALDLDEAPARDHAAAFAPERFAERFGRVLLEAGAR